MTTQLEISACGTNVALRFTFRIPVYGGKKGDKLAGFTGARVVIANIISEDDFREWLQGDLNKLAQMFLDEAIKKVVRENKLPSSQFVEFRGFEVCKHRPMTKPELDDPRWV